MPEKKVIEQNFDYVALPFKDGPMYHLVWPIKSRHRLEKFMEMVHLENPGEPYGFYVKEA